MIVPPRAAELHVIDSGVGLGAGGKHAAVRKHTRNSSATTLSTFPSVCPR